MSGHPSQLRTRWNFPEVLRSARGGRGWTQADLAAAIGVAIATVGRWERGDAQPQDHILRSIAHALGIDEHHLRASLTEDVPVQSVTRLKPTSSTETIASKVGRHADDGSRTMVEESTDSREDRFAEVVMAGLARGDGTSVLWTHNVSNLARIIGVAWSPPPTGPGDDTK